MQAPFGVTEEYEGPMPSDCKGENLTTYFFKALSVGLDKRQLAAYNLWDCTQAIMAATQLLVCVYRILCSSSRTTRRPGVGGTTPQPGCFSIRPSPPPSKLAS